MMSIEEKRAAQYEAHNQFDPPDWAKMVEAMFLKETWSLSQAANLLCSLDPDRECWSEDPTGMDEDTSNFVSDGYRYPWKLDALEINYWKVLNKFKNAANEGDLIMVLEEPPEDTQEMIALGGYSQAPKPQDCLVTPINIMD